MLTREIVIPKGGGKQQIKDKGFAGLYYSSIGCMALEREIPGKNPDEKK